MEQEKTCRYRQLKIKQGNILLKLAIPLPVEAVKGLILSPYQKDREADIGYRIPVTKSKKGGQCVFWARIPLKECTFEAPEWSIGCLISEHGKEIEIPCRVANKFMRKGFYLKDQSLRYLTDEGEIYFLLLTSDYTVNVVRRRHCLYDNRKYRLKECAAKILYRISRPYWNRKKIWIFFEKECRTAQDNGYYFFQYCMSEPVRKELQADMYYILDSSSLQAAENFQDPYLKEHLLKFYSWRYMMYLQAADLLISSESKEQAVVWRNRNSFLRDMLAEKPLFFLQHGVIGLKCLPHFQKNRECGCSFFITSSEYEQELVVKYLGYRKEETAVTGLARYDLLQDQSRKTDCPVILVMPTWRDWLDDISADGFLKSDFFRMYHELVTDRGLKTFLEENRIQMDICLHPKAQAYGKYFRTECKNIRFLSYSQVRLNEELMKARLLVTDYSSVAWDMLYMSKPTVFFQFDAQQYLNTHGSYLDFDKELFGRRAQDIPSLVRILKDYQEREYVLETSYEKMKARYFAYHDTHNCERICGALKNYRESERKGK